MAYSGLPRSNLAIMRWSVLMGSGLSDWRTPATDQVMCWRISLSKGLTLMKITHRMPLGDLAIAEKSYFWPFSTCLSSFSTPHTYFQAPRSRMRTFSG